MTTTTDSPTDEQYDTAINRLTTIYGSDAEAFVSVIEAVRDEDTVHHVDLADGRCVSECIGCFTERLADAITRVVAGQEAR